MAMTAKTDRFFFLRPLPPTEWWRMLAEDKPLPLNEYTSQGKSGIWPLQGHSSSQGHYNHHRHHRVSLTNLLKHKQERVVRLHSGFASRYLNIHDGERTKWGQWVSLRFYHVPSAFPPKESFFFVFGRNVGLLISTRSRKLLPLSGLCLLIFPRHHFLGAAHLIRLQCKYPYLTESCLSLPTWTAHYNMARRQHAGGKGEGGGEGMD